MLKCTCSCLYMNMIPISFLSFSYYFFVNFLWVNHLYDAKKNRRNPTATTTHNNTTQQQHSLYHHKRSEKALIEEQQQYIIKNINNQYNIFCYPYLFISHLYIASPRFHTSALQHPYTILNYYFYSLTPLYWRNQKCFHVWVTSSSQNEVPSLLHHLHFSK